MFFKQAVEIIMIGKSEDVAYISNVAIRIFQMVFRPRDFDPGQVIIETDPCLLLKLIGQISAVH